MRWLVDHTGLLLAAALFGVFVMIAAAAFVPRRDRPRRDGEWTK